MRCVFVNAYDCGIQFFSGFTPAGDADDCWHWDGDGWETDKTEREGRRGSELEDGRGEGEGSV